ncbi:MAG: tetratricopeptide repeat protein [Rickettsiales bacterium]|nr:tetratricopeptide repeat protein [Rickettsiales bacterium]
MLPRIFLLTAVTVCLSACDSFYQPPLNGREFLDANTPGPKVEGVSETMEKSAQEFMVKGEFERAGHVYRQLLDRETNNVRYLLGFAEAERRAGKFNLAQQTYEALLKVEPNNIEAKEGLGLALLGQNNFADAGRIFTELLKKDPKRWRTLNAMGLLFVERRMYDDALIYFAEALKFSPNNPSVLNNAGLTQAVQRNFPDARTALEKASELTEAGSVLQKQIDLNLAMVYGIAGDMEKAEEIASRHLKGPALYNNLGLYAHLAENDVMAKSYLNMALTESSSYYKRAWDNLSVVDGSTTDKAGFDSGKGGKRIKVN